jgi:hypothetical protein
VFTEIPDPIWDSPNGNQKSLASGDKLSQPVRANLPTALSKLVDPCLPHQTLAEQETHDDQPG